MREGLILAPLLLDTPFSPVNHATPIILTSLSALLDTTMVEVEEAEAARVLMTTPTAAARIHPRAAAVTREATAVVITAATVGTTVVAIVDAMIEERMSVHPATPVKARMTPVEVPTAPVAQALPATEVVARRSSVK
jgi:hypothetical protein